MQRSKFGDAQFVRVSDNSPMKALNLKLVAKSTGAKRSASASGSKTPLRANISDTVVDKKALTTAKTSSKRIATSSPVEVPLRTITIRFGSATTKAAPPSASQWQRNVETGRLALARAANAIATPGITVRDAMGVPMFRADPNARGGLIRELNNEIECGRIVNGKFEVSPKPRKK